MHIDLMRELKIASHDGDNNCGIFSIHATFDVGSMTSRQRMTGHFFYHQSGKEMLNYVEDKFYTILYSLHAVLQHAFTLTHPKQNKNF